MPIDLKTLTPITNSSDISDTELFFGAEDQTVSEPSVYRADALKDYFTNESAITVNTISDLLSADTGNSIIVLGYHSENDGGGGLFYWDATEDKANHNGGTIIDPDISFPTAWSDATQRTAWYTAGTGTGCWVRVLPPAITLPMFGAVGDQVTDDTLAVTSAVEAAANEAIILDGVGRTYKITSGISKSINNVYLENATFDISDISGAAIDFSGASSAVSDLAADASAGSTTITLNDASTLSDGDYILIESNDIWDAATGVKYGFINRVISVDTATNTITLESPLIADMLVASSASVSKITFLENFWFRNVSFIGNYSSSVNQYALELDKCRNIVIEGCSGSGVATKNVSLRTCKDAFVKNNAFKDSLYTGLAYGVSISNACRDVVVSENTFERMRHGVTIGGVVGVNVNIIVAKNSIFGSRDSGVDSHAAGAGIVFVGNTIEMSTTASGSLDGITCQASDVVIADNVITNYSRHGIYLTCANNSKSSNIVISGNRLLSHVTPSSTATAIYVLAQADSDVDIVSVTGNVVNSPSTYGVYCYAYSKNIDNCVINSNTINNVGTGVYLRSAPGTAVVSNCLVNGNYINGTGSYGIRCYGDAAVTTTKAMIKGNIINGVTTSVSVVDYGSSDTSGNL